jgi:lipopolysaccharide transport system ATP-binding protein
MSKPVIEVNNLSKLYRLGEVSTGTISHDFSRWLHRILGKEDPYAKVGQSNDRTRKTGNNDYVYALQDINFTVDQGEVLGIIGRNGAGKSTLLKILSRVTAPTTGQIKAKGRIAALLEVGTGFHPELTGRENIYLNGAILGMRRHEIHHKLDEIVDFSGCAAYLDTPVKRYSSGMTVRLGFSVAAHFQPEILVVDEVLAVGDAEFQKRCIGKMEEKSRDEGVTVIFVSHNMSAVTSLCSRAVVIDNGSIVCNSQTADSVRYYLALNDFNKNHYERGTLEETKEAVILSVRLVDQNKLNIDLINIHEEFGIEITFQLFTNDEAKVPYLHFDLEGGVCAFVNHQPYQSSPKVVGIYKSIVWIPAGLLNASSYSVHVGLAKFNPFRNYDIVLNCLQICPFENVATRTIPFSKEIPGVVRPQLNWSISKI